MWVFQRAAVWPYILGLDPRMFVWFICSRRKERMSLYYSCNIGVQLDLSEPWTVFLPVTSASFQGQPLHIIEPRVRQNVNVLSRWTNDSFSSSTPASLLNFSIFLINGKNISGQRTMFSCQNSYPCLQKTKVVFIISYYDGALPTLVFVDIIPLF